MRIRPLREADAAAVAIIATEALPFGPSADPATIRPWLEQRALHLLARDPGGCWVAEHEGVVFGVALAHVREGLWGLALMAVSPVRHGRGTGTALLRAALGHGGGGERGALIASSTDPRAMRLYARAGFTLVPSVAAGGMVDPSALPAGLRSRPAADLEAAGAIGRDVRGAAYAADDLAMLASRPGFGVVACGDRGFAVHHPDGSPALLCARDDEAATDLLWSCLAAGPRGSTVHVDFITAGQDWAVAIALEAGLVLSPEGPLFRRGLEGAPLRPWLPSGGLL